MEQSPKTPLEKKMEELFSKYAVKQGKFAYTIPKVSSKKMMKELALWAYEQVKIPKNLRSSCGNDHLDGVLAVGIADARRYSERKAREAGIIE